MSSCDGKVEFSAAITLSLKDHVTLETNFNNLIWCSRNISYY